jgi:hypothetical protein
MVEIVPLHKPPSKAEARKIICELVEAGLVRFHPHCQMRKRSRGITTVQIMNCLKKGDVAEAPFTTHSHKGWETSVVGSVSGCTLKVVVVMRWVQDLLTVTAYRI